MNSVMLLRYLNTRNIILGLFILTHLPYLFFPIAGGHRFRQATTAGIAMNFYQESANIFLPRIVVRGDKTGITGMEFPLYSYLVSLLYYLFGGVYDGLGKAVSLAFSIGVFLVAGRLFRDYGNLREEYLYPALFLVPLFYNFSARFMPEMMGLFFAVASLWLLLRDRERPSLTLISASTFCLALSVLVRPYFVFWGFGIIVTLGHEAIQMRRFRMRYFIAGLAVLIPFFLWYYVYSPYLVKTYGIDYFYRGAGLRENLAVIFEARYFKDLFYNFFKVLTGWPAAPFALWALFSMKRIWRGDEGLLRLSTLGILLITLIGLALVTGRHAFIHGYYYSPLIVPSAYLLALGFQKLDLRHHKTYLVALIAIILIMQVAYLRTYRREKDVQALEELRKETNVRTRSDELFVTPELGETPLFLYVLRRKGWALRKNNLYDPEKLAGLKDKGAKWVVTFEDASPRLHSIDQWLKNIGRKDQDRAR